MENMHIDRGKVLLLIRALDSKRILGGGDSISASMIKICDTSIVERSGKLFYHIREAIM